MSRRWPNKPQGDLRVTFCSLSVRCTRYQHETSDGEGMPTTYHRRITVSALVYKTELHGPSIEQTYDLLSRINTIFSADMEGSFSDSSDNESAILPLSSSHLQTGHYTITTVDGVPIGCMKRPDVTLSLVVTLPKAAPAPKWRIQRRASGHYTVYCDNLPIYFEQMALRAARADEEGLEWEIVPRADSKGVYKFKNASVGAYVGFEDVWVAPNFKGSQGDSLQVRVGDADEVSDEVTYFKVVPA
ncbi:hypothetical protein NM688_g851 [Phlebia brevispora]|uniref:Uncharacterized protein n=1 Tax=Phlebia brevispora TaxID=194682 RepID=A0ACC1TD67_9APHY|nr:hypothetical protein NM688_g851 [Phlebia brevispora]